MTSEYSDIYKRFLMKVTDYDIAGLDEKLALKMMNGWMRSVTA